jgi:hypothetical protein
MSSFQHLTYSCSDAVAQASTSLVRPEAFSLASAGESQYGRIVDPELLNFSISDWIRGYVL